MKGCRTRGRGLDRGCGGLGVERVEQVVDRALEPAEGRLDGERVGVVDTLGRFEDGARPVRGART
jgi:hypothetical protein